MKGSIFAKAQNFNKNERGVVLVLFLVLLIPILLLIAIAIDFSQFLAMKRQLQGAADAAALNLAVQGPNLTQDQLNLSAANFVQANFPSSAVTGRLVPGSISATHPARNTVSVSAQAAYSTSFLRLGGFSQLGATVSAQATYKETKLEIVLVLDNTGSMSQYAGNQRKIDSLKDASTTLINTLFGSNDTSQYVKIGLVPFTAAVNVGNASPAPSWIDQQGTSPLNTENLNLPTAWQRGTQVNSLFGLFSQLSGASWQGCVRQRPEPYDLQDTPPDLTQPNTLFVPYLAPSEPSGFSDHYLPDVPSGLSGQSLQSDTTKYQSGIVSGGTPNLYCPAQPVQTLTDTKTNILTAISAMQPNGNTVLPAGLMWGWHVLSPNAPYAMGASYSDPTTIKVIVLVTDGQNNISGGCCGFNGSIYNAYGYAGTGGHLTGFSSPEAALDDKFSTLCSHVKADLGNGDNRIVIYTIALGAGINTTGATLLQNCATDRAHYFDTPTSDDLRNAFQSIAAGLNKLRLSR